MEMTKECRISTITAIAKLNSSIKLGNFFDIIQEDENKKLFYINTTYQKNINHISFIEYGKTKDISNSKGINPKMRSMSRLFIIICPFTMSVIRIPSTAIFTVCQQARIF